MEETIKVTVVEYRDRKHLLLAYRDPITGRLKTKSAKTSDRRAAEKSAAVWEDELRTGRYSSPSRTTWAQFRERYESEVGTGLAENTQEKIGLTFDMIERRLNPQRVRDVTAQRLSWLASELRKPSKVGDKVKPGLAEVSIRGHMAHLKAALRWAERVGLIVKAPAFPELNLPKGDAMKGRPITAEEFDRLIAAVDKVVEEPKRAEWKRLLNGLWLSGFRVGEALALSWDDDGGIAVDLGDGEPMAVISAHAQKSRRAETLPLAPDFGDMLAATPAEERTGFVFDPRNDSGKRASREVVIRTISAIGRKAGVKVWTNPQSGAMKYATAHDLRRAFGLRWSSIVMPPTLRQMMRHATLATTMRYYVGRDAKQAGRVIREAFNKTINSAVSGAVAHSS